MIYSRYEANFIVKAQDLTVKLLSDNELCYYDNSMNKQSIPIVSELYTYKDDSYKVLAKRREYVIIEIKMEFHVILKDVSLFFSPDFKEAYKYLKSI